MSDDLVRVERLVTAGGRKRAVPFTFGETLATLRLALRGTPFKLAGIAPTANPFYGSARTALRHFIIGDLMLVAATELRFDPAFRLKEDYDYTCQHIDRYGGVVRVDWLLGHLPAPENPGRRGRRADARAGAGGDRAAEGEVAALDWGQPATAE